MATRRSSTRRPGGAGGRSGAGETQQLPLTCQLLLPCVLLRVLLRAAGLFTWCAGVPRVLLCMLLHAAACCCMLLLHAATMVHASVQL
jgi:hypothetical protein